MDVWNSFEYDEHEQICLFADPAVGLKCVVAIHSTMLGPACGGTRFKSYPTEREAVEDALRLSRAMSYKSALAGLPIGGGKSVIIGDPAQLKSRKLLHAYGRFINRIGETFVTGEDVGMSLADVETVAEVSPYMAGTSGNSGDPSIPTAAGVVHALRAVTEWCLGQLDFKGVRVAVQGLGAVGGAVAEQLRAEGAQLVVADVAQDRVDAAVAQWDAMAVSTGEIHRADVDIFVPCALGGIITAQSANEVAAKAVAGAANNQLADPEAGRILAERGILFAPDYVVNAGGIISGLPALNAITGRAGKIPPIEESLRSIGSRLFEIFGRSEKSGKRPEMVAEDMAREMIGRAN